MLGTQKRTSKRDPRELFQGKLGVKKGVPNGPFWAAKSVVVFFSPALRYRKPAFLTTTKNTQPPISPLFWLNFEANFP